MSVFETLKATLSSIFALKYKTDTQIFVQKQIWPHFDMQEKYWGSVSISTRFQEYDLLNVSLTIRLCTSMTFKA